MNISITNECNRRCDFCFQKEWYLSNDKIPKREMSLDNIQKILNLSKLRDRIGILGGEPLLYSDLDGLFNLFRNNNRHINILLTNFNVEDSKINILIDNLDIIDHILINCDYNINQEKQFKNNISKLPKDYLEYTLGTTLLFNEEYINKSLKRILSTLELLDRKDPMIRIAPMTPNYQNKYNIDNKFGEYILYFIDNILEKYPLATFNFDCQINNCEVSIDTIEYIYKNYRNIISYDLTSCEFYPPIDVLVDNSAIWCCSSKFININNIFDYNNTEEIYTALRVKYYKFMQEHFNKTDCTKCELLHRPCEGLCIAKIASYNDIQV